MNNFQQERCLICGQFITAVVGWGWIFSMETEHVICEACEGKLERIEGETCKICGRSFEALANTFRIGEICNDCCRWEEDLQWQGLLEKNFSLFHYNDFLKEVIAKFKYRGDYILAKVFSDEIKSRLGNMEADLFIPIPLSEERLYERGFNQAEALLLEAGFAPVKMLTRVHSEKQSKKSRTERIHLPQVFQLIPAPQLQGRKVILVDDIYTTGSTLRHAAKLLKEAGAFSVNSLTIAR
ncbi:ComF family protein [Neobacillus dielmonensis]|uniref:ComF family protein n=1 Tax=Neobacillus dielmonensis TaxID=1347369 RepID=UPI0005A8890E|nr:ComF family protein [Neobacillus dielmonensis]